MPDHWQLFENLLNSFPKWLHIFHQQHRRVPIYPHLCQDLSLSIFFIIVILLNTKCYLMHPFLPHTSEASPIMTTVEFPNMLQGRFTHFSIVSSSLIYASISAHPFSIYLLNTHYMPTIIPGEGTVNKTNISPMPLWSLYSSGERQTIKSLSNSG